MKFMHLTVLLPLASIILFKNIECSPFESAESLEVDTRKFMPKIRVRRNDTNRNRSVPVSAVRDKNGVLIPNSDTTNFVMATKSPPINQVSSNQQPSVSNRNSACSDTFCEESSNYPIDVLKRKNLKQYETFFGEDFVENISTRFDAPDELTLCSSRKRLIRPKEGLTQDNSWLTIINHDNYTQGVWIDQCEGLNRKCEFDSSFPNGIETQCKQNFVYRQLLSVDKSGNISKQYFKFPSCCQCVYTQRSNIRIAPASKNRAKRQRNT